MKNINIEVTLKEIIEKSKKLKETNERKKNRIKDIYCQIIYATHVVNV